MKFILEVDVPETPDTHTEIARILRYWGGAIADLGELAPGDKQDIYDSEYSRVGSWSVEAIAE